MKSIEHLNTYYVTEIYVKRVLGRMKICQWKIILVVLIMSICFVNCDNKDGKKGKQSSNNKKKCKNNNNGVGKGSGRSKGSGEDDCVDSSDVSSITVLPNPVTPKPAVPIKLVETTESASDGDEIPTVEPEILPESESNTEHNNIVDTIDPFTEESLDYNFPVTDNENINTMVSSSTSAPIRNKPNNENTPTTIKYPIRPTKIQISTVNPLRRTTKSKSNKDDDYTKNLGSGRPANCINCRHPPTTTKLPRKNRTLKPMRLNGSTTNDGRHNIKTNNYDTQKPINSIKSQGCFANEHNYWFGIYLPNRINTFYRSANYFRVGQNYWYGLFLPNLLSVLPNGCSTCNQHLANQKTSSVVKKQEKKRVMY